MLKVKAGKLREILIVIRVKLQKSHHINILYTTDKKFSRQLPFIPSYYCCYGKQVTMETEGYFYISAVWRCRRPRVGTEVTVDKKSNFCVYGCWVNNLPWQQVESLCLSPFKTIESSNLVYKYLRNEFFLVARRIWLPWQHKKFHLVKPLLNIECSNCVCRSFMIFLKSQIFSQYILADIVQCLKLWNCMCQIIETVTICWNNLKSLCSWLDTCN